MTGTIDQLGFDAAALATAARFGAYHDFYAAGADVDRLDGPFDARTVAFRLDRSLIFDRRLRGVGHHRDAARVRRDPHDHLTLTLVLAGTFHGDAGSGFRRIEPGELLLLDMTSAMHNRAPDAHIVTMSMARAGVARVVREPRRLHGQVIPVSRALMLADHMISLTRHASTLDRASLMAVSRVGLELLAAALGEDDARRAAAVAATERVDRVRAFIEGHLFDPTVGPETVLDRFALSRATLYRDFQQWGGLASYIRRRRIEALRDRLADPAERRSLADLAELIGFSGEVRLSEAFLSMVGVRPGAYRRAVRSEPDVLTAMRLMREWPTSLR